MNNAKTILILDEARTYGGTIEVTSLFTRTFAPDKYKFVFVSSVDEKTLTGKFSSNTKIVSLKKSIDYTSIMLFKSKIESLPTIIKKILIYGFVGISYILNLKYYFNVIRVLFAEKPALFHVNNGYFGLILAKIFKGPFVAHIHSTGILGAERYSRLLHGCDRFIAISQYVRQNLIASGFEGNKISVVYNAADVVSVPREDVNALKERYNINSHDKVIGFFGRVVKWKGQKEFLLAVSLLVQKFPGVKVLIIGDSADDIDTSYIDYLKDFTNSSGLSDKVVFVGYQNNVHPFYEASDLIVHCSITPEPFGLVIVEAMSHKKPVIVSNLGTPPEIINNGVEGLIVDPFDTQSLASAMLEILSNDQKAEQMGNQAYLRVTSTFSPANQASGIEKVYNQLISS